MRAKIIRHWERHIAVDPFTTPLNRYGVLGLEEWWPRGFKLKRGFNSDLFRQPRLFNLDAQPKRAMDWSMLSSYKAGNRTYRITRFRHLNLKRRGSGKKRCVSLKLNLSEYPERFYLVTEHCSAFTGGTLPCLDCNRTEHLRVVSDFGQ